MSKIKQEKLGELSIDDLIGHYATAALLHGKNTISGNYRETNRHHDIIAAIYRELKLRGDEAVKRLTELLENDDDSVKVWAAAHTLEFNELECSNILEKIGLDRGLVPLAARMTLREWRKGTLKFP